MTVFVWVNFQPMIFGNLLALIWTRTTVVFCCMSVWIYQQSLSLTSDDHPTIKSFYVELNLQRIKCLINCSDNPHWNNISKYLYIISKSLDDHSSKHSNVILLSDFNASWNETPILFYCNSCNLTKRYLCALETGLSDFHWMTVSVMKMTFRKFHQDYKIIEITEIVIIHNLWAQNILNLPEE